MQEKDKALFEVATKQQNIFDWEEFQAACPDTLKVSPGEWVMKMGILSAGRTMFPEKEPYDAYQSFIEVINQGVPTHVEHSKQLAAKINTASRPCCGGGAVK